MKKMLKTNPLFKISLGKEKEIVIKPCFNGKIKTDRFSDIGDSHKVKVA